MNPNECDADADNVPFLARKRGIFLIVFVILFIMVVNVYLVSSVFGRPKEAGTAGDMFGGVTALFSGLAFAGLIVTLATQRLELKLQRQELKMQRNELAASNKEYALQRFDSQFFGLLKLFNDHITSIQVHYTTGKVTSGRDAMRGTVRAMRSRLQNIQPLGAEAEDKIYKDISEFMESQDDMLAPYFRLLVEILRRIDADKLLSKHEKDSYVRIIGTQLSGAELVLIFMFGFISDELRGLVEKYALLRTLPDDVFESLPIVGAAYNQQAFGH